MGPEVGAEADTEGTEGHSNKRSRRGAPCFYGLKKLRTYSLEKHLESQNLMISKLQESMRALVLLPWVLRRAEQALSCTSQPADRRHEQHFTKGRHCNHINRHKPFSLLSAPILKSRLHCHSLFVCFCCDRVSLCTLVWPGTPCVNQLGLKLTNSSDCCVLGLKLCAAVPSVMLWSRLCRNSIFYVKNNLLSTTHRPILQEDSTEIEE